MKLISQIKAEARNDLKNQWSTAIVMTFIIWAVDIVVSVLLSVWFYIDVMNNPGTTLRVSKYLMYLQPFVTIPMIYGYKVSFLGNLRGNEFSFETLFSGFKNYTPVLKTMAMFVANVLLYGLLLIVPGVIKALDYTFVPYLMRDRKVYMREALWQSEQLMKGHRMRLFKMYLSFMGLILLSLVTLGVAALWVCPYIEATTARFYEDILKDSTPSVSIDDSEQSENTEQ